jgi:alpha-1,2-mannosyltransferase
MGTKSPTVLWPKGRIGSWLAVVAFGIVAQAILWSLSEPTDLFSDFYKAYFPAADRLWTEGPVATWETEESAAVGFVNLPILAWLFVPFAVLGEPAAGWAFLAVGIAAVALTYALLLRLGDFNVVGGAMLALSILASGPLVNSLREGNTTHFILLLLVVALLLWRAGAEYAAGLVLGLCALFKLPLMLFGLYALLRGHWRVVAGGATAIVAAALLSLAVFGLEINIGWYRNCIAPFVGGVMPAFNVQSIDGFLARLASGPALLMEWTPLAAPLWHKIVRSVILSAMFILAFVATVPTRHARILDRAHARGGDQPGVMVALLPAAAVAVGALSGRPARTSR